MSDRRKNKARLLPVAANASIIVLELIGTSISYRNGGLGNLRWYTVLSNVFALVTSIAWLISYLKRGGKVRYIAGMLRYMASCCLAVTFLTVIFVLVPMAAPSGGVARVLYKGPQIYHHILCPLISCLSFIFLEQGMRINKKMALASNVPTLTYAVVFIILNLLRVTVGPYPFLHVYEQPVYMSVIWFFVIAGVALGSSFLIGKLHNKLSGIFFQKKITA